MNLGPKCNAFVSKLPDNIQLPIQNSCLDFLSTVVEDLQKRLPLTDPFFEGLAFLKPEIALSLQKPNNLNSLENVWGKFSSLDEIDGTKIDVQWKNIAINFSGDDVQKKQLINGTVEEFWEYLKICKNFLDEYEYFNIVKLAHVCMSLPHSNATTERVFSVVTDVKTKKRNKLSSKSLNAVCLTRFSKDNDNCCQSFSVSEEHIELMKSNKLYKK